MARVKRGVASRKRRKGILAEARGHRGGRSRQLKAAHEETLHAGHYAFMHRRTRRRGMRRLWTMRINAAVREFGLSYSRFIAALHQAHIAVDRKILADLAVNEPSAFAALVKSAQAAT
ncbi:MAG: 50S ribosomal protein L20 [Actinobacteria bacterium]|nr:50S ribosomal protein L20 [Actinomycetota bacterium]